LQHCAIHRPAIVSLIVLLLYTIFSYSKTKNDLEVAASMQLKLRSQKTESIPVPHDLPDDLKACFDTSLWFHRRNGSLVLDLMDGRVKYINASHQYEPAYNATCPFMKPRYNCDGTPNGKKVSRWNFILEHNATSICDLRKLILHIKGPGGVAKLLLDNSPNLPLKQTQDKVLVLVQISRICRHKGRKKILQLDVRQYKWYVVRPHSHPLSWSRDDDGVRMYTLMRD
jgi:hypothetical protein